MANPAPPKVVLLAGNPAEMGLSHGRLLSNEIRLLVAQVRRHVFRRLGVFQGSGVRIIAYAFALAMNRHIPPRLRQEMRGIALGSDIPYSDVLLLNTLDDVLNILRRLAPRTPSLGCSGFALFGSRCRDGMLMLGRNLDYHFRGTPLDDGGAVSKLLHWQATLFAYLPHDRAGFVSVGWPGFVGTATAINEEGISLGNLTSYLRGASPNGVPATLLYRTVIEEASRLGEVGDLLRAARRTMGNNLMVGSGAENRAALFELTPRSVLEVAPTDGMLVATNHFTSPALARRQHPYVPVHSLVRWRRLRALCDRYELGLRDALAILGDAGCEGDGRSTKPFERIANEGTAMSALFRPTEMEVWLGMSAEPPASSGHFQRIDAAKLLAAGSE